MALLKSESESLEALHSTVMVAASFFSDVDENLSDGWQTARQILAHLVFWHREYARVIQAIADGEKPNLLTGKFRELNARAWQEFARTPMPALAQQFRKSQSELESAARQMRARETKFAFKQGSKPQRINYWLPRIEAHVRTHVVQLKRAEATQAMKMNKRQK